MVNLIIFLSVLSVLVIVHEFGHFFMAKKVGVKVEKFSLGFGPVILKRKIDDTEYSVSSVLLGGYVKLAGDSLEEYKGKSDEYFSKSVSQRAAIVFFGPLLNYILGILLFWLILFIGFPSLTTKVGGVISGLGAKDAGVQVGDKVVAVDNKKVELWEEMQKIVQAKKDNSIVKISVLRNHKNLSLDVKIKTKDYSDPLGRKHTVGLLGITPDDEIVKIKHGFFESFFLSLNKTWELTALTYTGLWRMVTGKLSMRDSVTGPLGIFYITSEAVNTGFNAVLHLVAVLSVSLAIFNLLPLPILDGGHILFLAIEKIRGKSLSVKVERIISQIGLSIIIMLALFVTYNDIVRFFKR